jgi:hypothetical protein
MHGTFIYIKLEVFLSYRLRVRVDQLLHQEFSYLIIEALCLLLQWERRQGLLGL